MNLHIGIASATPVKYPILSVKEANPQMKNIPIKINIIIPHLLDIHSQQPAIKILISAMIINGSKSQSVIKKLITTFLKANCKQMTTSKRKITSIRTHNHAIFKFKFNLSNIGHVLFNSA